MLLRQRSARGALLQRHRGRLRRMVALRSGATLPLADVYRDEAQSFDICDVHGKMCF